MALRQTCTQHAEVANNIKTKHIQSTSYVISQVYGRLANARHHRMLGAPLDLSANACISTTNTQPEVDTA